ncbi:MAG: hypothetical protein DVB31_06070 [Verrucomicrobia bacterium]|nr:MAG: hypothetical protein DVB31_06070 [Verrucomicrobiota bacterium]
MFAVTCMRKLAIFIIGVAVLCGLAAALALNPLTPSSVAIAVGDIQTNRYRDDSLVAVSITISNRCPAQMAFDTTYQMKTASGWASPSTITTWHSSSDDDWTPIQPFAARTIHLPVPGKTDAPWRVVVQCTGTYSALTPFERLRLNTYLFLFRSEPVRFFLSSEQPANPALQATAAAPGS